jgi:hypothetical protein
MVPFLLKVRPWTNTNDKPHYIDFKNSSSIHVRFVRTLFLTCSLYAIHVIYNNGDTLRIQRITLVCSYIAIIITGCRAMWLQTFCFFKKGCTYYEHACNLTRIRMKSALPPWMLLVFYDLLCLVPCSYTQERCVRYQSVCCIKKRKTDLRGM